MWKKTSPVREDNQKEISHRAEKRIANIMREVRTAFALLRRYPKLVTFFGSARMEAGSPYYEKAHNLSRRIVTELEYAIITGGGPGIMEAANKGAYEAHGKSIGLQIVLPHAQILNQFLTDHVTFYFLFVRRMSLSYTAEAYIFFPGGFGTLDEFFEVIELIQTRKVHPVPVILYGKEFWEPLDRFIKEYLVDTWKTIDPEDRLIYTITENDEEILETIKKAPLRKV